MFDERLPAKCIPDVPASRAAGFTKRSAVFHRISALCWWARGQYEWLVTGGLMGILPDETVSRIAQRLKARGETVAVAESSTGGLISASLLAVPGASAWYLGGSVVYTLVSRRELIRITAADVEGLEPLSEPMVRKFAQRARDQLGASWGVAELGAAGPTGARYGHPAGTSVIAVAGPVTLSRTLQTGSADREHNMWQFTRAALALLDAALST
jgi:PncC family amidohydrolase